ncbi:hypothetical protein [Nocardioides speluncae]|uniref:hypothetical protein n=1 Tax=Nocardioides speluncae TaxID=2670337 RepID=UPI000D68B6F0|nr:hypothetical protein [Nocardioides speluncae]
MKLVSALAATVLVAGGLTGCSAIERALDCADAAATIAGEVQDVQNAGEDPRVIVDELRDVERTLEDLKNDTDNAEVKQAVEDLEKAVTTARTQAEKGKTPNIQPVTDAASDLTNVCAGG